jgi:type IV pilus assembly protein PilF
MRLVARLAGLAAVALLSACAQQEPQPEGPTVEATTQITEPGDPRNRARLHTELGSLYYTRGNMTVALEELRAAVAADPNYALAYGAFGMVYMDLKENALAEENFQRGLRLAPTEPDLNHNYGWFLCQTSREPESIKYFLQAIRNPLYPAPWRSYAAAGVCSVKMKKTKDAEEFFQRALKLEPDEPNSLLKLGQIRYDQGRIEDARTLVTRYVKVASPTAESLWLGLRIERKAGMRVAEQSYATQLRRRFPASDEYRKLQRGEFD